MDRFLFRGKRIDNGEWIIGNLLQNEFFDDLSITTHSNLRNRKIRICPTTVGQCTGLKDKNGKLIYEGDIVATSSDSPEFDTWSREDFGLAVVRPLDPYAGFMFKGEQICWNVEDEETVYSLKFIEVIGNIHDNPELLKSA